VFVCWAKVGKAKLIANPRRASRKRIFIGFLQVYLERSVAREQRERLWPKVLNDMQIARFTQFGVNKKMRCAAQTV
jgi:hypothetical protein